MNESIPGNPPLAARAPNAPILSYGSNLPGGTVTIGHYASAVEAALPSAELAAEGIPNNVLNENVNALGLHFAGFSVVELQVHESDAARAREVLERINADDLEPAAIQPDPPTDDQGNPLKLGLAEAFETVRALRDARTVLASAGIVYLSPKLVRRGEAPPGEGRRFFLQVREEDVARAQSLLREAKDEADDDDESGRCPRCGSWRIYPVSDFVGNLLASLWLAPRPEKWIDCLACNYRGPAKEFGRS